MLILTALATFITTAKEAGIELFIKEDIMGLLKKVANKIGLRKRRYYTLMIRPGDYFAFKALAAQEKMNHVDLQHKLMAVYVECKKKNYEAIIADLEKKQDALVDVVRIYQKRVGKIYNSPADKTHIGSNIDMK